MIENTMTRKIISQKKYKIINKKMIGGNPIKEEDIMYQNDLVCILNPNVKKGIIIFSEFTQPPKLDSLCSIGLKTGQKLQSEGVKFGRSIFYPYIFFRAPYCSREINYSTIETELISSYGQEIIGRTSRVFIRVDPDKTFVFSSEIRVHRNDNWSELNKSKKTLTEYLRIIKHNESIKISFEQTVYNLYTSEKESSSSRQYPLDVLPIERNSEILVGIPHLDPCFFVTCFPSPPRISTLELISSWKSLPSQPSQSSQPSQVSSPLKKYFPNPTSHPPKLNSIWDSNLGIWKTPKK
jgi:hypothetical protein